MVSWPSGGMADARDLKSRGLNRSCGFESRLGYLKEINSIYIK